MNNNPNEPNQRLEKKPSSKDTVRLMPKTLYEIKEIQRARKTLIKTKYVKKYNKEPYPIKEKTEEELRLEKAKREKEIQAAHTHITYSSPYFDDTYEYRHVVLPKILLKYLPSGLLQPQQWIDIGVRQSPSWEHYMIYAPEPHILLFRRDKEYRKKKLILKEAALKESKTEAPAEEDSTSTSNISNISNIPPSSRTGLFRTRTLR